MAPSRAEALRALKAAAAARDSSALARLVATHVADETLLLAAMKLLSALLPSDYGALFTAGCARCATTATRRTC
jgi:hypothetical protein